MAHRFYLPFSPVYVHRQVSGISSVVKQYLLAYLQAPNASETSY